MPHVARIRWTTAADGRVELVSFSVANEAAMKGTSSFLAVDQPINLTKRDGYLYLVVGDPIGRRIDTIELPVDAGK
jgi:hypothetical protein